MIQHVLSWVLKWDSNYHKYKHLISQKTECIIECETCLCCEIIIFELSHFCFQGD